MLQKTSNAITFCNILHGSCNNMHNISSLAYHIAENFDRFDA